MECVVLCRPAAGEKRQLKEQQPLFRTNVVLVIPNVVSWPLRPNTASELREPHWVARDRHGP